MRKTFFTFLDSPFKRVAWKYVSGVLFRLRYISGRYFGLRHQISIFFKKVENERSYFKRGSPATNPSKLNFHRSSDDNDIIFGVCLL